MVERLKPPAVVLSGAQQSNLKLDVSMILMALFTTEYSDIYDLHQADNAPS